MRRAIRALAWLAAVAGVVALVAVAGGVAYRRLTAPVLGGTVTLPGLTAAVDVVRDAAGIPHVYATSDDDAWFAIGWLHAQDRLWQLELNRRTAAGRLAEILGPSVLDADRFLRTLGVARNAAAVVERLDPATRHVLERYAAGVNANLEARRARSRFLLPIEFVLTGAPFPEPWGPADSVGWSTMMAWDLSTNWTSEIARMRLSTRLSKAQIDELLPPYPGVPTRRADGTVAAARPDPPLEVADYPALYRRLGLDAPGDGSPSFVDRAAALAALAPPGHFDGIGSNDWVVAGSRTVSGKPLLANDPHLSLTAPSIWYLAHLSAPGLDVVGGTLPGLPFVVIGRNDRVAWGVTNTGPDTQDLYIEELRTRDGPDGTVAEARTPTGWQPVETRREVVHVRGGPDVAMTVRSSRHGPLISDVSVTAGAALRTLAADRPIDARPATDRPAGDRDAAPAPAGRFALAFQWAALRADDRTIAAGLALDRARDWSTFVAALADFHAPQQNFVYADVDGHIGFIAPGRIPLRKPDNDLKGQVPSPGWDARYDWDGFVPFERLPHRYDPPEGRIVTANHKVVDDAGPVPPPYLTSEWVAPYRARRIEALIDAVPKHDVASFGAIQADVRSLSAVDLLPLLVDVRPSNDDARAVVAKLAAWDGTMSGDRIEPLIYAAWVRELTRLVSQDELGPELFPVYWDQRLVFLTNVLSNRDGQARWCLDVAGKGDGEPAVEACAGLKARALDLALADLSRRLGPDRTRWRWDALHVVRAEHRPFSRVPWLARFFDLEGAVGGDSTTVDVAGYAIRDERDPFVARHGSSLREIVDLADPERSRFMPSTGVSGDRMSPLYANLFDRWRRVESVPMQTRRDAVERGAVGTLRLAP